MLRVSRTKPLQKFLVAVVWGCELRRFEKMKNLVLVFLVPLISCRALLFGRDGKTFFYNISRARIYQILCGPCFEIHVSLDTTIPAHFLSFHIFLSFFPNQFLSCSKIPSVLYVSQLYPSHPFFQCKSSKISFLCLTLLFTPFHSFSSPVLYFLCCYLQILHWNTYTLFDGWMYDMGGYFANCVVSFYIIMLLSLSHDQKNM